MDSDLVAAEPAVITKIERHDQQYPIELEIECFSINLAEAIVAEIVVISDLETAEDRRILREAVMTTVREQIAALKSRNE